MPCFKLLLNGFDQKVACYGYKSPLEGAGRPDLAAVYGEGNSL